MDEEKYGLEESKKNIKKLCQHLVAVNFYNVATLNAFVSRNFELALMEPNLCELCAISFFHLADTLPNLIQDNEVISFKNLLLDKCHKEFESRCERDQDNKKQYDKERKEKRSKAKRRMLGNIRLIGELYKKGMLTERRIHEYINKLLGGESKDPNEEDIEALCKLMSTIGVMIDHPKGKEHTDSYFERMRFLSNNMNLSPRVKLMLKRVIDLRKNKWQHRRKVEGLKKISSMLNGVIGLTKKKWQQKRKFEGLKMIEEMHRDASKERKAKGEANSSARRIPMDSSQNNGSDSVSLPAESCTKDRPKLQVSDKTQQVGNGSPSMFIFLVLLKLI